MSLDSHLSNCKSGCYKLKVYFPHNSYVEALTLMRWYLKVEPSGGHDEIRVLISRGRDKLTLSIVHEDIVRRRPSESQESDPDQNLTMLAP